MTNDTVGVIGTGFVGRSVCEAFDRQAHVVAWDRADAEPYPHARLQGCLPKDLAAIVSAAAARGYEASLLAEALATNERIVCEAMIDDDIEGVRALGSHVTPLG